MSQTDQFTSSKTPKWFDNSFQRTKLHPGTYIGIVKNANDPERIGRLQVWLPELGGTEDDTKNWTIVRYASPFMGSTNTPNPLSSKNKDNKFSSVSQTYGFWAVPPDIGNQVLITFVNGDRNKGFWFACVMDRSGHSMLPGNPGGKPGVDFDVETVESSALQTAISALGEDANLPLAEFNRYNQDVQQPAITRKKTLHEFLAPIYINQGLDRDIIRGPSRSSAQRDMPSSVFGMSTPGAPANAAGDNIYGRQGGHSFVMDDGDAINGAGKQVRLRSSGGHQILMDDEEGCLYVINSSGSAWVELSRNGSINMFGASSMSIRTRGNFNLHSDDKIKIYGEKGIEMFTAGNMILEGKESIGITGGGALTLFGDQRLILLSEKGGIQMDAKGDITIKSAKGIKTDAPGGLNRANQDTPPAPKPPGGITTYNHDDVVYTGGIWSPRKQSAKSIVPVFPTHEPWNREGYDEASNQGGINATSGPPPQPTFSSGGTVVQRGGLNGTGGSSLPDSFVARFPGVAKAQNETVSTKYEPKPNSFNKSNAPKAAAKIPGMAQSDMEDFKAGLAMRESGGDPYNTGNDTKMINQYGYAGRYQFGASALETLGYLKPGSSSSYGNNGMMYKKDVWTGKDGIKDMTSFLGNPVQQDAAACALAKSNHKQLLASGVIDADSPPEHIAGMLSTAHLLGAQGAINWAKSGIGRDANGTTGASFYASGRNAVVNNISKNYK